MRNVLVAILLSGTVVAVTACAGSPNFSAAVPSASETTGGSTVAELSTDVSTAALPSIRGFGGTITFAGISGKAAITLTAALTAPVGSGVTPSGFRRTQSGTIDVLFYLTLVPAKTIDLLAIPSINLTLPPAYASAGKQFYYAISQPPPAGAALEFRTEGPGSVTTPSVRFDATLTPLTLQAGKSYTLALYGLTSDIPPPQLLYVANATRNSITAFSLPAQGNVAPIRTIAGDRTQLNNPVAIAVDGDGNLAVVNALSNGSALIAIFSHGANGDVSPLRTFRTADNASDLGFAIALDPFNASIAVALATDLSRITTFSPTGTVIRSLASDEFNVGIPDGGDQLSPAAAWSGLNFDSHDRLVVGFTYEDRFNSAGDLNFFAPNASGSQHSLYGTSFAQGAFIAASAYSRSFDQSILSLTSSHILTLGNTPSLPTVRQYAVSFTNKSVTALAVDRSGELYVSDTTGNAVWLLSQSGASSYTLTGQIAGPNTQLAATAMAVGSP